MRTSRFRTPSRTGWPERGWRGARAVLYVALGFALGYLTALLYGPSRAVYSALKVVVSLL